jgi:hypothetical protein
MPATVESEAVWIVGALALAGALAYLAYESGGSAEGFTPNDALGASAEDRIIVLYQEILQRSPSPKELKEARRIVQKGGDVEYEIFRRKLLSSDEYEKAMKTQSDTMTPSLKRMLADRDTIGEVSQLYRHERKRVIPKKVVLPLKDVYVYMNFNEYLFRAMLRNAKYPDFEEDMTTAVELTREDVIKLYEATFYMRKLEEVAAAIRRNEGSALPAPVRSTCSGGAGSCGLSGTDKDALINELLAKAKPKMAEDNDPRPWRTAATGTRCSVQGKDKRIYLDAEKYVLRPDMSWSVPQRHPPVCTTLGKPALVQPVVLPSKVALNGLPLKEAIEDTSVGSIMPKFEPMRQYIDV